MHLLDARPLGRTLHKRPKVVAEEGEIVKSTTTTPARTDGDRSEILRNDFVAPSIDEPNTLHLYPSKTQPMERKRKKDTSSGVFPSLSNTLDRYNDCGTQSKTNSSPQFIKLPAPGAPHSEGIESIIDGALRLSVHGSFSGRSTCGLRVKANTFRLGLADVAPVLWKPGYLLVRLIPNVTSNKLIACRNYRRDCIS